MVTPLPRPGADRHAREAFIAVSHHCAARVGAVALAAGAGCRALAGNAKAVATLTAARNGSVPRSRRDTPVTPSPPGPGEGYAENSVPYSVTQLPGTERGAG